MESCAVSCFQATFSMAGYDCRLYIVVIIIIVVVYVVVVVVVVFVVVERIDGCIDRMDSQDGSVWYKTCWLD